MFPMAASPSRRGCEPQARPVRERRDLGATATEAEYAGRVVEATLEIDGVQLVRRCLDGDSSAWALMVRTHHRRVYGLCYRFTGNQTDAEDLTQDVFLRVIQAADDFRGQSSFATFVFRIVRNLCIDVMRARAARPDAGALPLDGDGGDDSRPLSEVVAGPSPEGDARTFSNELSTALEAGLVKLPAEQREVFLMREVEGLRFGEIADVLGVNENTVKSRMHYAVTSLRESLGSFRGP